MPTSHEFERLAELVPTNTAQALLLLSTGTALERSTDDLPTWIVAFVDGDECDRGTWAQVFAEEVAPPPAWTRVAKETKKATLSPYVSSHTARGRMSWGVDLQARKRAEIVSWLYDAPLYVRRRLRQIGRLTASLVKSPSEKNAARIKRAWSQVRDYAVTRFDEDEDKIADLLSHFWGEWEREGTRVEKAAQQGALCGARCRNGKPCQMKVYVWPDGRVAKRCRLHGGKSTGPKTQKGREAIGASNRERTRQSGPHLGE